MEELLTIPEMAQRLRVDETTVRRWIQYGVLQVVVLPHLGKRQSYRIPQSEMDKIVGQGKPQEDV